MASQNEHDENSFENTNASDVVGHTGHTTWFNDAHNNTWSRTKGYGFSEMLTCTANQGVIFAGERKHDTHIAVQGQHRRYDILEDQKMLHAHRRRFAASSAHEHSSRQSRNEKSISKGVTKQEQHVGFHRCWRPDKHVQLRELEKQTRHLEEEVPQGQSTGESTRHGKKG